MGLFDGVAAPAGFTGASADLAARLGLPVVLVLDVSGQSQTAAAVARGVRYVLRPDVRIAGVILNRVASERHRGLAADAIDGRRPCRWSVRLPRSDMLTLPERHLGLVQASEMPRLDAMLDAIADFVAAHVDLERDLTISRRPSYSKRPPSPARSSRPGQRIAIARDAAFSFFLFAPRTGLDSGRGPACILFPRSPTRRRRTIATSAGCRAAIPNCMPVGLAGAGKRFRAGLERPSPRRARCTASAAATWCWGKR